MSANPASNSTPENLEQTPLFDLHNELGAKMVPFAGFSMPVSYPLGVLKEHLHTREKAGLFDVSHMGQAYLAGPTHEAAAAALEAIVPGEIGRLGPGRQRYTMLLSDDGGIIDDLMVSRSPLDSDDGRLMLIVNAARKDVDYTYLRDRLPAEVRLEVVEDRALLALQGPAASAVMAAQSDEAAAMGFMRAGPMAIAGIECHVSRSGYTGEDGFEISVPAERAAELAHILMAHEDVEAIGLGARDSLRLEAGLCLYGHDIDETTSPIEADLKWAIGKRRREEGGFAGAEKILAELEQAPARLRVGIRPDGRAPAREGAKIHNLDNEPIGVVTSGGFGPTLGGPLAMGYVTRAFSALGTDLQLMVRGKALAGKVAPMPFVPHRYFKKPRV